MIDARDEDNRNKQLEEQLRIEKECALAVKYSIVDTIGGTVEGKPTTTGNYLQRIRELVKIEKGACELENSVQQLKAEIAALVAQAFAYQDKGDKYGVDFILDKMRQLK